MQEKHQDLFRLALEMVKKTSVWEKLTPAQKDALITQYFQRHCSSIDNCPNGLLGARVTSFRHFPPFLLVVFLQIHDLSANHNFAPETSIRDVAIALRKNEDDAEFNDVLAKLPEGAVPYWQPLDICPHVLSEVVVVPTLYT
jgi:hypothetical protein